MPPFKTRSTASISPPDVIALLKANHLAVGQLFDEYSETRSTANKQALIAEICAQLRVHMQIKEEILYPELKTAVKDRRLVPERLAEHAALKTVIAELTAEESSSEVVDARLKLLWEYVAHHVKEEQTAMFCMAEASSLDLDELGARMAARKHDLMKWPRT